MQKHVTAAIITLFVGAIIASAKSIIDVHVLKAENINVKETLLEIKKDVREIRNKILER
jgi:Na+/pantothenate symporter